MIGQEGLAEAGHTLRPGQVGPADQAAQASVARRIAGQQDQVGATRALTDTAQVLLDRLAAAGQPSSFGARPNRDALGRSGLQAGAGEQAIGRDTWQGSPAPDWPAGRHDDLLGIRGERIEQLDLDPEHRPEPGFASGGGEPDDAVEPVVVGNRQPRQAELQGTFDELVGG